MRGRVGMHATDPPERLPTGPGGTATPPQTKSGAGGGAATERAFFSSSRPARVLAACALCSSSLSLPTLSQTHHRADGQAQGQAPQRGQHGCVCVGCVWEGCGVCPRRGSGAGRMNEEGRERAPVSVRRPPLSLPLFFSEPERAIYIAPPKHLSQHARSRVTSPPTPNPPTQNNTTDGKKERTARNKNRGGKRKRGGAQTPRPVHPSLISPCLPLSLSRPLSQYSAAGARSATAGLASRSVNSCSGDLENRVLAHRSGVRKPYVPASAAYVALTKLPSVLVDPREQV